MAHEKELLVHKNRPGSSCPKKYSVLNKEYTEEPICTGSRQYQHLRLLDLKAKELNNKEFQKQMETTTAKECLCVGLSNAALMVYSIPTKYYIDSVSICPGPNIAYFDKLVSLKEMVDHIYGRGNVVTRNDRPHLFLKELDLYIKFFEEALNEAALPLNKQKLTYLISFAKNLNDGIQYYRELFGKRKMAKELLALENFQNKLHTIAIPC
jgi:hypothetical protein